MDASRLFRLLVVGGSVIACSDASKSGTVVGTDGSPDVADGSDAKLASETSLAAEAALAETKAAEDASAREASPADADPSDSAEAKLCFCNTPEGSGSCCEGTVVKAGFYCCWGTAC